MNTFIYELKKQKTYHGKEFVKRYGFVIGIQSSKGFQ